MTTLFLPTILLVTMAIPFMAWKIIKEEDYYRARRLAVIYFLFIILWAASIISHMYSVL